MIKLGARVLSILLFAGSASAQPFPGKPVRIIPFGTAGGPVDTIARLYAERLRARWQQPVVVEAKPGASGTLAADAVAKAPPDGTTFMITLSLTHINNAVLQKDIPYDPFRDFAPLTQLAVGYGPALIARADAPFGNLREMIEYAKKKPGGLSYGTWGTGSTPHLYSTVLARQQGVQLVHVPYKGEAAAHLDLLGGTLELAWANPGTARGHLNAGKIKVLGVTGTQRSEVLPEAATFGEQGFKGFEPTTWMGAYAPAKTPPAIVAELSAALREATRAPEIVARWKSIGFEPTATTAEEFARIHQADFPKWAQMIREAGLKAQ